MRILKILSLSIVALSLSFGEIIAQSSCNMPDVDNHVGSRTTKIYSTNSGEKAIFFTANLDVNTDGAPKSYHPNDPEGKSLALNNMANAITALYDENGNNITCGPPEMTRLGECPCRAPENRKGDCFKFFMTKFKESRDANYSEWRKPRFRTGDIIPWRFDEALGRRVPCLNQLGYFVSQTALHVNREAGVCDQSRYLNAMTMHAIVLPGGANFRSQGVVTDQGDLVVLLDAQSGKIAFAVVGDTGPPKEIGEGTVALAAFLGGKSIPESANYEDMKALARGKVHYLIFPTRDIPRMTNGKFIQQDIDRLGKQALDDFGGLDRLKACAQQ
jgi:hypothetical protein